MNLFFLRTGFHHYISWLSYIVCCISGYLQYVLPYKYSMSVKKFIFIFLSLENYYLVCCGFNSKIFEESCNKPAIITLRKELFFFEIYKKKLKEVSTQKEIKEKQHLSVLKIIGTWRKEYWCPSLILWESIIKRTIYLT